MLLITLFISVASQLCHATSVELAATELDFTHSCATDRYLSTELKADATHGRAWVNVRHNYDNPDCELDATKPEKYGVDTLIYKFESPRLVFNVKNRQTEWDGQAIESSNLNARFEIRDITDKGFGEIVDRRQARLLILSVDR